MDERESFLKAIEEDEDDESLRMVYSDWLEENGEYEEASRQRSWCESKKWLQDLCDRHNEDWYGAYGSEYANITYQTLVAWGQRAVGESWIDDDGKAQASIDVGPHESLGGDIMDNNEEFWKHWSVVSGQPLPGVIGNTYYRCGC